MEDAIQIEKDPIKTQSTMYFWVPVVLAVERDAYERFYQFNITDVKNGTTPIRVVPAASRPRYIPYTLFVPRLPNTTNQAIYGLDLLPYNVSTTSVLCKDASEFLSIPSALIASSRTENNYGFVAVSRNSYGRGYIFGRIGSKELLEFSLPVPRNVTLLACYVTTRNSSRQALFFDNVPELSNATTVVAFNAIPTRSLYYTADFSSYGEIIMVAVRYRAPYAARFAGNTWVILAAVLAPVCSLIVVIWVILAMW
jgi:hypothetical protein